MKKLSLLLLSIGLFATSFAKQIPDALKLQTYKLKNGLTVYLNEDHSSPTVMGMVAVKGGSRRDPQDATGIAHYFEHIMFKGSEKLGTTDYTKEKVYLDSIAAQYDLLAQSTDKKERESIQLKINQLSLEAGKYAIPNEFDRIIAQLGGDNVNAYTSYDEIVYFNTFPASQMENWLDIYSDRFENPVFRLFQSELETVYEEKNMYADNIITPLIEKFLKEMFAGTPYGEQTVLGSAEHLKNPSLNKMRAYYDTYYVPNNMALILTGDFNPETTKLLVEEKFGKFETKKLPKLPEMKLTPFEGRKQISKRLTPIKIGLLGFHTVPEGHEDQLALNVCSRVLSNYSSTGLLDELTNDNELMAASMEPMQFGEVGGELVVVVPKIIGQSIGKAEKMVWEKINKLKSGDFDDDLLEAVKLEMYKENQENIEDAKWRSQAILSTFTYGKKWDDIVSYSDRLKALSKDDIVTIANKYYGDDYLAFYSKMGFPKKDKVVKPPYKPVKPENSEAHSDYYNEIVANEVKPDVPRFIEKDKDFSFYEWNDNACCYYVENPINEVFSIRIKFKMGEVERPDMELAAWVMNYSGADTLVYADFMKALQKQGAEIWTRSDANYVTLNVTGLEENLDETMKLVNQLITTPRFEEKEKEKMVQAIKMDKKWSSKDVSVKADALYEYALYKNNSSFLLSPEAKELKKMSADKLLSVAKDALKRQVQIHYVGSVGINKFKELANAEFAFLDKREPFKPYMVKEKEAPKENVIYFMHDKKAIQSQIKLCVLSDKNKTADVFDCKVFNQYFCGNMSSLVFQEIREFRSLAYYAGGRYKMPYNRKAPAFYYGAMKTQADKTNEAIAVYTDLLKNLPEKPERIETIKNGLKQSINSGRPGFRYMSNQVPGWKYLGFTEDPNKMWYPKFDDISFDQVTDFYKNYIKDKPMVITIVGDKSRIDVDDLKKYGKVIEVKKKDILK